MSHVHALTTAGPADTRYRNLQIRRQYILHRLFVLSIYHPARGFDIFASSVASAERHELLLSARATLRLQIEDTGIWANWDLVVRDLVDRVDGARLSIVPTDDVQMITWAAILILQGAEGGVGEHEGKSNKSFLSRVILTNSDLSLVQKHLDKLQATKRPAPSIHHMLASRIETWLQNFSVTPTATLVQPELDMSWSIFGPGMAMPDSEASFASQTGNLVLQPHSTIQNLQEQAPMSHDNFPQENHHGESWDTYDQMPDLWPSHFGRIFGYSTARDVNNPDSEIQ